MEHLHTVLKSIGLLQTEREIYLQLLKIGTAPASSISRRTGINKSTAQYTCQKLSRKGIVRMIKRNRTFLFTPEPPEKLLQLLELQKKDMERKEQNVQQILGSLKQLSLPNINLPKVEFFEGKDEMIDLYERLLIKNAPIDCFEEKGDLFRFFSEYALSWQRRRIEKRIFNRSICPEGNPLNTKDPAKLTEIHTVDPKKYPFSCDIKISADLVVISSFQEESPVGIGIEHADIAENYRLLFNCMWNLLSERDGA